MLIRPKNHKDEPRLDALHQAHVLLEVAYDSLYPPKNPIIHGRGGLPLAYEFDAYSKVRSDVWLSRVGYPSKKQLRPRMVKYIPEQVFKYLGMAVGFAGLTVMALGQGLLHDSALAQISFLLATTGFVVTLLCCAIQDRLSGAYPTWVEKATASDAPANPFRTKPAAPENREEQSAAKGGAN